MTAFTVRTDHSFDEFQRAVEARPTAQGCWINSSQRGPDAFTAHTDYRETLALIRNGWKDGAARIVSGLDNANRLGATTDHMLAVAYDVAGALPDVGRYLAGDPECMVDWLPSESAARPVLRVFLPGAYSALTRQQEIENFGIALLSHVDALERAGRSVELNWYVTSESSGRTACTTVTLKEAHEHFDLDRLAFTLAHPCMLRRCWFALLEPKPEYAFLGSSFGAPMDWPADQKEQGAWYLPRIGSVGNCSTLDSAMRAVSSAIEALAANDNRNA